MIRWNSSQRISGLRLDARQTGVTIRGLNSRSGSPRAFAAIRSSPVGMTGLSSLCIEVRILPWYGAHVSLERFNPRWPLPHVAGSPDLRVLSASLTSDRPSGLPRVARQTLQAPLEPVGPPLFA